MLDLTDLVIFFDLASFMPYLAYLCLNLADFYP